MRITRDGISQYLRDRKRAINTPGMPIPGMGGHHSYTRRRGGGNKIGAITRPNKEWGSQARKQEEHQTGIARRAANDAIAEGLAEMEADEVEWAEAADAANCWDDWTHDEAFEDIWDREMA